MKIRLALIFNFIASAVAPTCLARASGRSTWIRAISDRPRSLSNNDPGASGRRPTQR